VAATSSDPTAQRSVTAIVRADAARLPETAVREHQTHLAYLAEILPAEIDDGTGRIAEARFPRIKRLADHNPGHIPGIAVTLDARARGAWIDAGQPVVLLGDSGPARPTCSSASGWPPASRAAESVKPPPPPSSTNSPEPPASSSRPASWAATAASTRSCWTSSAMSRSIPAAPNCCSR